MVVVPVQALNQRHRGPELAVHPASGAGGGVVVLYGVIFLPRFV